MITKLLAAGCLFASFVSACSSSDADRTGTAGSAGSVDTAGASNAGAPSAGSAGTAGGAEGFVCKPGATTCDSWTEFSQATTASWGKGSFTGGVTTFGKTLTRDTATDGIHVTGTVDDYGYGVGLFFIGCADLSEYTGVSFELKGSAGTSNKMIFQLQTNEDYPWEAVPADKKGTCTATDKENPFGSCVAPSVSIDVADGSVSWTDLTGGMPVSTASSGQSLGLQWAFPYDGKTAYEFDVTLGNVQLLGGTGVSCSSAD